MSGKTIRMPAAADVPFSERPAFSFQLGFSPYGTICGCFLDERNRPFRAFRDLGELLIYMEMALRGAACGNRVSPQYSGCLIRCCVIVLYRQHGSFQGVLNFCGQKYLFRSGMELLYLLREAVEYAAERSVKEACHVQRSSRSTSSLPAG